MRLLLGQSADICSQLLEPVHELALPLEAFDIGAPFLDAPTPEAEPSAGVGNALRG